MSSPRHHQRSADQQDDAQHLVRRQAPQDRAAQATRSGDARKADGNSAVGVAASSRQLITPEVLAQVAALRAQGLTFAEIGAQLGFTGPGLSMAMRRHTGGAKRGKVRLTEDARGRMLDMRAAGATIATIALELGFSSRTVELAMCEARAEGDERASKDPAARRAALLAAGEEVEDDAPEGDLVLPDPRVVASLMQRGFTRRQAIDQSIARRKAQARVEQTVAAVRSVTRVTRGPYQLGQSLHAQRHGAPCE